ncbi:hypothetical protein ELQ35_01990 [Peribacillus cavernae]|uniref:Uncharacterized protein n=1 Tax=Peribacillus cavernae TaxID=1674310 RepID=A0A3S0WCI4_9BACI|nr:hypothetical protein [Peribacillus cavernae]MDQ0220714.1 hypothetical protein [Peribacillus cavernae]RUQ32429.1 hypothetical protein ELQ35_01990 [Peribacillus cavernae]
MIQLSERDRNALRQAVFLPIVLKVLEKDRLVIEKAKFTFRLSYLQLLEQTIAAVHKDIRKTKEHMWETGMKIEEEKLDDGTSRHVFIHKGQRESHTYPAITIRNNVYDLLDYYLFGRFEEKKVEVEYPVEPGPGTIKVQLTVHMTGYSRSLHQGSFPVNAKEFRKDPQFTAAVAAYEFVRQIKMSALGHMESEIEQVLYNNEQDITEVVRQVRPMTCRFKKEIKSHFLI